MVGQNATVIQESYPIRVLACGLRARLAQLASSQPGWLIMQARTASVLRELSIVEPPDVALVEVEEAVSELARWLRNLPWRGEALPVVVAAKEVSSYLLREGLRFHVTTIVPDARFDLIRSAIERAARARRLAQGGQPSIR